MKREREEVEDEDRVTKQARGPSSEDGASEQNGHTAEQPSAAAEAIDDDLDRPVASDRRGPSVRKGSECPHLDTISRQVGLHCTVPSHAHSSQQRLCADAETVSLSHRQPVFVFYSFVLMPRMRSVPVQTSALFWNHGRLVRARAPACLVDGVPTLYVHRTWTSTSRNAAR
jgi:hypothetical protein